MIDIYEDYQNVPSAETIRRLRHISPATFGHLISHGFAKGPLRPLSGVHPVHVVGRAYTVSCRGRDGAAVHLAIGKAREGDVLVIDRGGDVERACWGEMTTRAALECGLAGTIVYGAVTDVAEIIDLNYPVWSSGISALTTVSLGEGGRLAAGVTCGGVRVHCGDIVLADENGVLFMDAATAEGLLDEAEAREAREADWRKAISSGHAIADISGASNAEIRTIAIGKR